MQTNQENTQNTKSQPQLNIIDDINVKNADICSRMETRIKGLIFILDSYIMSLEVDKKLSLKIDKDFNSNHIYLQFGMSNLNILLDLLLEDNSKLEENQKCIDEMLNKIKE